MWPLVHLHRIVLYYTVAIYSGLL